MFFGDNVKNTIQRLLNNKRFNILYRPHGSCYDHYITHSIKEYTRRLFISNNVQADNCINTVESKDLDDLIETRLCAGYNFQIAHYVNKNVEAVLVDHSPLIYVAHTKEDVHDIKNNILGLYPYTVLVSNENLFQYAKNLEIDNLFYNRYEVKDDLDKNRNVDQSNKEYDVGIFKGGQDQNQLDAIISKISKLNLKVKVIPNNYTTKALSEIFDNTKMIIELNPINIYNIIYSINCGLPSIIYNKEQATNTSYTFSNMEEMIGKIKNFLSSQNELPQIGFNPKDSTDFFTILSAINSKGLIL